MKSKITTSVGCASCHASKKSLLLILTLLLGGTVYAQGNQLQVIYESAEDTRLAGFTEYIDVSGLTDANGDGVADLIMRTLDNQGNLQDLLVVTVSEAGPQEYWRIDSVPVTLGLGEDVEFIGFTDALGGPVRQGIFVGNLSYLVDPRDNAVSWADDNGVPAVMEGTLDLTEDGFDDLVFFLPDTKQVRVWSIDH